MQPRLGCPTNRIGAVGPQLIVMHRRDNLKLRLRVIEQDGHQHQVVNSKNFRVLASGIDGGTHREASRKIDKGWAKAVRLASAERNGGSRWAVRLWVKR